MKVILYTENEKSIKESLCSLSYNFIRSHHYSIFHLARLLNADDVLDSKPLPTLLQVVEGSDLYYTSKEFPEYTLNSASPSDYDESIGVIFHCAVTKSNYHELYNFLSNVTQVIYYNSDKDLHPDFFIKSMFLSYVIKNPNDPLSILFKKKCNFMMTGYSYMKNLMEKTFNIPTYYVPQIINPNFPKFKSEKVYDGFIINTGKMQKQVVDELKDFKILSLVKDGAFVPGHDSISCPGNGMHLDILLTAVSMCKYYVSTYLFQMDTDYRQISKISMHNLTSKYFECYYSNTYPITSLKTLGNISDIMRTDTYKTNIRPFKAWMEDNFTLNNYKPTLIKLANDINKVKSKDRIYRTY